MNYGGFWLRVAAYLIDMIVIYIAMIPLFLLLGLGMDPMAAAGEAGEAALGGATLLVWAISIIGPWLYFALMESSSNQATLGKMVLGMTVTDANGGRIGFGKATGRYFGKILSSLILMIGYIMVAFTARKQGLHDMLAGTLVLKARPGEAVSSSEVFE